MANVKHIVGICMIYLNCGLPETNIHRDGRRGGVYFILENIITGQRTLILKSFILRIL